MGNALAQRLNFRCHRWLIGAALVIVGVFVTTIPRYRQDQRIYDYLDSVLRQYQVGTSANQLTAALLSEHIPYRRLPNLQADEDGRFGFSILISIPDPDGPVLHLRSRRVRFDVDGSGKVISSKSYFFSEGF